MGGFEEKVRGVLSDTLNLPSDFLSMIPQYVAQNPVPLARTPGTRIASGKLTSSLTGVAGTTFGTGSDVLAAPLAFTADGKTDYAVRISARTWDNSTAGSVNFLHVNLDGNDVGRFAEGVYSVASTGSFLNACGVIVVPSSGSHTLNVRMLVNGGVGRIIAGIGGAGNDVPILVTLEVA